MKKIYSIIFFALVSFCVKATTHNINISGTSYSPPTLTVSVGDVIVIQASGTHPLVEVSQATWNANGTTPLSGGFGTKTSTYTFTVTTAGMLYYVCSNHVTMGMKGQITILSATGIQEQGNAIEGLSLFPNPAKDKVSVKFNSAESVLLSIKLYSICGQEVETLVANKEFAQGANTVNIALPTIPAGVYFVQLNYNSKQIVKKLIID